MSDPQKTIREALEYASEMSIYSSEWRRYSKALAALKEMGQDSARIDWFDSLPCAVTIIRDQPKSDSGPTLRQWIDQNMGDHSPVEPRP